MEALRYTIIYILQLYKTANMIRGTAVKPEERKRKIMEGLRYTIIYITIIQNS